MNWLVYLGTRVSGHKKAAPVQGGSHSGGILSLYHRSVSCLCITFLLRQGCNQSPCLNIPRITKYMSTIDERTIMNTMTTNPTMRRNENTSPITIFPFFNFRGSNLILLKIDFHFKGECGEDILIECCGTFRVNQIFKIST